MIYEIEKLREHYSKSFIKGVLDDLKLESLESAYKKGKLNIVKQVLLDRNLFRSGHVISGDMQYSHYGVKEVY